MITGRHRFIGVLLAGLILSVSPGAWALPQQDPAEPSRALRVTVYGDSIERHDALAEVSVRLPRAWFPGVADASRTPIQAVEVDLQGRVLDPSVLAQFDARESQGSPETLSGTLLIRLGGHTPKHSQRYFRVSPDSSAKPALPLVRVEEIPDYEGEAAWKVITAAATYFYHQQSGGFASLIDRDGNDWIGYHPGNKERGEYRGIPNIAPPQFHPGRPESKRPGRIVHQGPLRVRLLAETEDGQWGTWWDIYPTHARMTLFKKGPEPYWILYEGTPGGEFETSDYWVDSAGRRFESEPYTQRSPWHGDLPDPEWVYFGDAALSRVLLLAREPHSGAIDEYWHFGEGGMTVFGFGRGPRESGWQRLTSVPSHLTIGLVESTRHEHVADTWRAWATPLQVGVANVP